jgi:hypothetical protein
MPETSLKMREDSVMADRWMDERDREWRDRDWRRSERFGRGYGRSEDERFRGEERPRWTEDRTWQGRPEDDEAGEFYGESGRSRAYREEEADYRDEDYGRGGRPRGYRGPSPRFASQDYTGRRHADEAGRTDYGYSSRERYGAERDWPRDEGDEGDEGYGERRGGRGFERDRDERRRMDERAWRARGYDEARDRDRWEERRGEGGGDFLQRAGERISSWFRGGREEDREEPRRYSADFGREARWVVPGRGHQGRGPKGYKRPDERINEEVHERLTDDPWIDASDIRVEVKDGEVTLSGHVDNREAKHRAERLIEQISGVGHVQNDLRVDPNAGLTGAGRGYGSSALEAEMRRSSEATGAEAERSTKPATEPPTGSKTGPKGS